MTFVRQVGGARNRIRGIPRTGLSGCRSRVLSPETGLKIAVQYFLGPGIRFDQLHELAVRAELDVVVKAHLGELYGLLPGDGVYFSIVLDLDEVLRIAAGGIRILRSGCCRGGGLFHQGERRVVVIVRLLGRVIVRGVWSGLPLAGFCRFVR